MHITFDGAARTVTGSMHLIEVNGYRLLLECGLYQGRRQESYEINLNFPFSPNNIDAVLLSHAHIDHSGNLPNLVKHGYNGSIFATQATNHLVDIMLKDSGHIQEADAAFINKIRARRGEPLIKPLYTQEDAIRVGEHLISIPYEKSCEPVPGVQVRFVEAGHILGSAAVVLDIEEKSHKFRLWFSGDIGRRNLPLLRDPVLPNDIDYLVMECTYGDKPHEEPQAAFNELRKVVTQTINRGGKVIIPAFAVGRTQELVYGFNEMMEDGLPKIPVYVDSPLAVSASDIFRQHPECFDEETRRFVQLSKHPALDFDQLIYIRTVEESKALNDRKGPMIIISASGMAESGRILHHLRNNIEDSRNTIVIVSWQAPYTLGRRLADREKQVKIFGEVFNVLAEVATIGGLSCHAGQKFLIEYALNAMDRTKQIFLVHGEEGPATALQDCLHERGLHNIVYPDLHESIEI